MKAQVAGISCEDVRDDRGPIVAFDTWAIDDHLA
jgi:hypothetical protein